MVVRGRRAGRAPKLLVRCLDGDEPGMMDYLVAAVLFIFIVAVLVLLWRREHRPR